MRAAGSWRAAARACLKQPMSGLHVVEFQARPEAGAPPPSVSNNSVAHPMAQKWTTKTCSSSDAAMGDGLEARVASEPAKDAEANSVRLSQKTKIPTC